MIDVCARHKLHSEYGTCVLCILYKYARLAALSNASTLFSNDLRVNVIRNRFSVAYDVLNLTFHINFLALHCSIYSSLSVR